MNFLITMGNFRLFFFCCLFFLTQNLISASYVDSLQLKMMIKRGKEFQDSTNLDSAWIYFEKVVKNSTKPEFSIYKAEALKQLGVCYFYANNFEKALSYYNQAIDFRKKLKSSKKNSIEIANILHNIAIIDDYMGNSQNAINHQYEAEEIRLKVNDRLGLAKSTYPNLGAIYLEQGNFSKAQEFFFKTLKIYENLKNEEGIADSYDNLGVIFEAKRDYNEALQNYLNAYEIRKKLENEELLSYSYNNIGVAFFNLNNFSEALKYYNKSLEIKTKLNDKKGIANTLNNIGLTFQELKKFDLSYDAFKKSLEIEEEIGEIYGKTNALINLGTASASLGRIDEAMKYLNQGYNLSIENNFNDLYKNACENLSIAYHKKGMYKEAFEMLFENKKMSDSLFNEDLIKRLTSMEMQYKFDKKITADSIKTAEINFQKDIETKEKLKRKEITTYSILIVFVLVLILAFVLFRIYRLKQSAKQNQLKQMAGEIEKKLLRSQMNPHFIFNSMNSIQNFISQNDSYSAQKYLSKFAGLMRAILENSSTEFVCLSDEISALQIYLELEQLRFNNKFSFSIDIDEDIETEFINIPPMLIQPYVENAILHGVMNLETEGKIEIQINCNENEKLLNCNVIDNGIGRAKAKELKLNQKTKHKSVGMQITSERLNYLNRENEAFISVEIIDLFNDLNEASGTQVKISIPYNEN